MRPRKHAVTCVVCGDISRSNYATEALSQFNDHMQEEHR